MLKFFSILFITSSLLLPAGLSSSLEKLLVRAGYESVSVVEFNNDLIITYENRIHRFEMEAMVAVMEMAQRKILSSYEDLQALEKTIKRIKEVVEKEELRIKEKVEEKDKVKVEEKLEYLEDNVYENIILIPLNREVPIVAVTFPFMEWVAFSNGEINGESLAENIDVSFDTDEVWWIIKGKKRYNKRNMKLDVVVYPVVKSELDRYGDPYRFQFSLAPALETSFGQGSLMRLQYLIPIIYNEFDVGPPQDKFRPGLMNLNQTVRLPQNLFMSASFGFFTDMRYGIDLELRKYLLNGMISLGMNSGLTGMSRYYEGNYDISIIDALTYYFDVEARIPIYNLSLAAQYGQYINEDKGFRIDVERQFGEWDIGFFVERSSNDNLGKLTTGGFYFSVPLWPSEYNDPGFIRIRPSEQFHWEYNATHFIYFHQKRYKTGHDVDHFLKRLQPDNVNTYIKKLGEYINK